ncbi:basic salivary proline-rich protein 3-like [Sarcophilus harrisii]|uniref:basic salivary proline-rich protein 3-like n=1 Tax=Sarcophilus harrisii TaxID=9305 RepID=UPI001301A82E|nr:basic salivary proline-rich protein 3-like [Sarcophilus harrisii]
MDLEMVNGPTSGGSQNPPIWRGGLPPSSSFPPGPRRAGAAPRPPPSSPGRAPRGQPSLGGLPPLLSARKWLCTEPSGGSSPTIRQARSALRGLSGAKRSAWRTAAPNQCLLGVILEVPAEEGRGMAAPGPGRGVGRDRGQVVMATDARTRRREGGRRERGREPGRELGPVIGESARCVPPLPSRGRGGEPREAKAKGRSLRGLLRLGGLALRGLLGIVVARPRLCRPRLRMRAQPRPRAWLASSAPSRPAVQPGPSSWNRTPAPPPPGRAWPLLGGSNTRCPAPHTAEEEAAGTPRCPPSASQPPPSDPTPPAPPLTRLRRRRLAPLGARPAPQPPTL